jgi:hypothetical protein
MPEAIERSRLTTFALCNTLERFISDNEHSRDVMCRWFSSHLKITLDVARQVRNDRTDDAVKAEVAAFRLAEIAAEKQRRQREIDELDQEARKISAKAAAKAAA